MAHMSSVGRISGLFVCVFLASACGRSKAQINSNSSSIAASSAVRAGVSTPWSVPVYPAARQTDQVDEIFGRKVADPFRWMENNADPELQTWIEAQNSLVRERLDGSTRKSFEADLRAILDISQTMDVTFAGGAWTYTRRAPGEAKLKLYRADDLSGAGQRLLLDPDKLGISANVAISSVSVDPAGRHAAVLLSLDGSDEQLLRIVDVATGNLLSDTLFVKFGAIQWMKQGGGFYYSTDAVSSRATDTEKHWTVRHHTLGEQQARDRVLLRTEDPSVSFNPVLTEDEKHIVVVETRGWAESGVSVLDVASSTTASRVIFPLSEGVLTFAGEQDGKAFFVSAKGAPNGKLISIALAAATGTQPQVVVPEGPQPLEAIVQNGRIFLRRLVDVKARLSTALLAAPSQESVIELPGIGDFTFGPRVKLADGRVLQPITFFSFTVPSTIIGIDTITAATETLHAVPAPIDMSNLEVTQEFYPSKDGTRIPMFLIRAKGTPRDGKSPTILYGYGGFSISLTPSWGDAHMLPWVTKGGTYAVANLRGGLEYGEAWHQAGMLLNKQNVFDDFIAAAEYLVSSGVTQPAKLGIHGASNGGLLVGAVLNQRPDLFGAAVPGVGVMDMLRYQLFTAGKYWVPEYGDPQDPIHFANLIGYSPIHNIRSGTRYPATMVTVGASDERVVPMHSYKYAATLQAAQAGEQPILIRVETGAGHGAGGGDFNKRVDSSADLLTFFSRALIEAPTAVTRSP